MVFFGPSTSITARAEVVQKAITDLREMHEKATSLANSPSAPPCLRALEIDIAGFMEPHVIDLPRVRGRG